MKLNLALLGLILTSFFVTSAKADDEDDIERGKWKQTYIDATTYAQKFIGYPQNLGKYFGHLKILQQPFHFSGRPLVVQYEAAYEDGQECANGYIKLLSTGPKQKISTFTDQTPYSIMFGPDFCGQTAKIHLIVKIKNPINGDISEHRIKEPEKYLTSYYEDKLAHLYTLKIGSDNKFSIYVDNSKLVSGNLLKDLIPPIEPAKEIKDPSDKKPDDWDDREYITDKSISKPEDWDESQPKEVIDDHAKIPMDWLEEEEALIPDTSARQPEDWDEEVDGEWESERVYNPKCRGISGCGKWTAPMIANPLYKGEWVAPKIQNPTYKGKWQPKMILNPYYYQPNPYEQLEHITAIGWTSNWILKNILITDDLKIARRVAAETISIEKKIIHKYLYAKNPSTGIFQRLIEATEEKPWLWAVYILALLIPTNFISVFCIGRKSFRYAAAEAPQLVEESEEDVKSSKVSIKTFVRRASDAIVLNGNQTQLHPFTSRESREERHYRIGSWVLLISFILFLFFFAIIH